LASGRKEIREEKKAKNRIKRTRRPTKKQPSERDEKKHFSVLTKHEYRSFTKETNSHNSGRLSTPLRGGKKEKGKPRGAVEFSTPTPPERGLFFIERETGQRGRMGNFWRGKSGVLTHWQGVLLQQKRVSKRVVWTGSVGGIDLSTEQERGNRGRKKTNPWNGKSRGKEASK